MIYAEIFSWGMCIYIILVIMLNKVKRQAETSACLLILLCICLLWNALITELLAPLCIECGQYP